MRSPTHIRRCATGLKTVLDAEPGLVPAGVASNREQLFPMLRRTAPDVLLVDAHLSSGDASTCARTARRGGLRRHARRPPPRTGTSAYWADAQQPEAHSIAGGTGLVGRHTAAALESAGQGPVILARSFGSTGSPARASTHARGVDAVVDVLNSTAADPDETRAFFAATSRSLLAAEQRAGVGHHVLLSVVGLDRVEGNAHYAGKREQGRIVSAGRVPFTILARRSSSRFGEVVAGWTTRDGAATLPPRLVQPMAVTDVA